MIMLFGEKTTIWKTINENKSLNIREFYTDLF